MKKILFYYLLNPNYLYMLYVSFTLSHVPMSDNMVISDILP